MERYFIMNKLGCCTFILLLGLLFTTSPALSSTSFETVRKGYELKFPKDHGAHSKYATEWWYFTGHLETTRKRTFGFEVSFFRVGINSDDSLSAPSPWTLRSIYLGHFAITDDKNKKFYFTEKMSRGTFDDAGASETKLNLWLGGWDARFIGENLFLRANHDDFSLMLNLDQAKPLVLNGENGFSQKHPNKALSSYYTSITRLEGKGTIRIKDKKYKIENASAWMDHEFSSSQLEKDLPGWDWFALQLDNNEELLVYQVRNEDGLPNTYSAGTWIYSDGVKRNLNQNEFQIYPLESWKSEKTGITYPSTWQISIPSEGLHCIVTPTVKEQEMITTKSTGITYWEGRCKVEGRIRGKKIKGNAYAELVGYDKKSI